MLLMASMVSSFIMKPLPRLHSSTSVLYAQSEQKKGSDKSEFWFSESAQKVVSSELGLKTRLSELERQGLQEEKKRLDDEKIDRERAASFINTRMNSSKRIAIDPDKTEYSTIQPPSSTSSSSTVSPFPPTSSDGPGVSRPSFLNFTLDTGNLWVEKGGNYVYTPENLEAPLGVIHFLGGAFVGAAPHLTYRYLLESLGNAGYIVVATPYRLDMDYVRSCDDILTKFDTAAIDLARQYGPIPVIGLGHSCGALLQTLITSLFPDAPRAANILISFNNKPAASAIPAFEEIIVPLSEQIMGDNTQSVSFRETIRTLRNNFDQAVHTASTSQLVPAFVEKNLVPLLKQSLEIIDQIPPLLKVIRDGEREFSPSPIDTKEVCRRMYRARHTLLIKFENDAIDESLDIEKVLREANTIMRMKRPMIEMEVDLRVIQGTHITPLTQNIFIDPPSVGIPVPDLLSPVRTQVKESFLLTINAVKSEILTFLNGILRS